MNLEETTTYSITELSFEDIELICLGLDSIGNDNIEPLRHDRRRNIIKTIEDNLPPKEMK